jgi:predicted TIM-barrel fold metal-dependent hydrolase
VQYQSNRNRDQVRRFFIRYQDRLLYGTDLTQEPGASAQEIRQEAHAVWLRDWSYLSSDRVQSVPALDAPVAGLALPRSVLRKIYAGNAERWFGRAAWAGGASAR